MAVYRVTLERIEAARLALGPGPWAARDLVTQGWSPRQLESAVRGGALTRPRRGMYEPAQPAFALTPGTGPITPSHVRVTLCGLSAVASASHDSAALLHGQWSPGRPARLVHATIPGQAERWAPGLRVHAARLPEEFVTLVDGVRTTTIARTAVDLARGLTLPHALVAVDGAYRRMIELRRSRATDEIRDRSVPGDVHAEIRAELEAAFAVTWSWPGTRVVRAALDLVDPASESPFESWSRGWMLAVGLPSPTIAAEVVGASGRGYVGDFVWRSQRLIGEADGLGKYGTTGGSLRAGLRAERERQADLEAAGWRFVRWVTGDRGAEITARIGRALYLRSRLAA